MERDQLMAELRRLNGAAALAEHEYQVAGDVLERARAEHLETGPGERNEAAARFDAALREAEKKQRAFTEALARVWVTARRVAA